MQNQSFMYDSCKFMQQSLHNFASLGDINAMRQRCLRGIMTMPLQVVDVFRILALHLHAIDSRDLIGCLDANLGSRFHSWQRI